MSFYIDIQPIKCKGKNGTTHNCVALPKLKLLVGQELLYLQFITVQPDPEHCVECLSIDSHRF